jgi:hypothetical protein
MAKDEEKKAKKRKSIVPGEEAAAEVSFKPRSVQILSPSSFSGPVSYAL